MVVMMTVVVMICSIHHLRLRRDRNREAENEENSDQKSFHVQLDEFLPVMDASHPPA
jgi:hypothetical protein